MLGAVSGPSFTGGNLIIKNKTDNIGCNHAVLGYSITPSPMFKGIFQNFSKRKLEIYINTICREMSNSLQHDTCYHGSKSEFDEARKKMLEVLDKYSRNDKYSSFVKEVLEFLNKNYGKWYILDQKDLDLEKLILIIECTANNAVKKDLKGISNDNMMNSVRSMLGLQPNNNF